ncbi:MAG: protein-L-isoaspartate O-methyltransferase family protein [Anaerolineales bacterium]
MNPRILFSTELDKSFKDKHLVDMQVENTDMKKWILALFALVLFPMLLNAQTEKDTPKFQAARKRMVATQIKSRGITDINVLNAMAAVPRHNFVPKQLASKAYADHPLPIGQGQTISQPYIVALMTDSLKLKGNERVLEIGTGSGFQAAILATIAKEVYTIEIKEKLHKKSNKTLMSLGFNNIKTRHGDGYFGWSEAAPFDCIMITVMRLFQRSTSTPAGRVRKSMGRVVANPIKPRSSELPVIW